MSRAKCPNCGNTNPKTIEDNGLSASGCNYMLLCVAPVDPSKWAFRETAPDPDNLDDEGKVACGMQWCPNA